MLFLSALASLLRDIGRTELAVTYARRGVAAAQRAGDLYHLPQVMAGLPGNQDSNGDLTPGRTRTTSHRDWEWPLVTEKRSCEQVAASSTILFKPTNIGEPFSTTERLPSSRSARFRSYHSRLRSPTSSPVSHKASRQVSRTSRL